MIPAAGTTHDLRVMLCAPRTQEKNKKKRKKRVCVKHLRMNEILNTKPSQTQPPHVSPLLYLAFHA